MKNEKTKLIIWATVALIIGVIIGTFLIAPATTGNAKSTIIPKSISSSFGTPNTTPIIYGQVTYNCGNGNSTTYYDVPGDLIDATANIACAGSYLVSSLAVV